MVVPNHKPHNFSLLPRNKQQQAGKQTNKQTKLTVRVLTGMRIVGSVFVKRFTKVNSCLANSVQSKPEIKDISSPLAIISGISYYTPEQ